MDFETLLARVKARDPEAEGQTPQSGDPFIVLPVARAREVLSWLRGDRECDFDSLMCLSGVDSGPGKPLEVVYHLHSLARRHKLTVKVRVPRERTEAASVSGIWAGAEFHEREAYDLYGIVFTGHPDLRRILLPFDWEGWPGRQDYVFPKEYQGVALAREEQFFAEDVARSVAEREQRERELTARLRAERKPG